MRFSKAIVLLCLFIVPLFSLCACARLGIGGPPATETPEAESGEEEATATPAPVYTAGTTILAEGQLVAEKPQLPLALVTNGRLLELRVQAGDRVRAGDVIATLDDKVQREALTDAGIARRQAQNNLAQAQLALDDLLNWEPDEAAVSQAEANLAAAEASLQDAQSQDSVASYSVTSARIALKQAQEGLADAHEAYETAFDPGRDWEQFIDDPSCRTGEQFPNCTGPPISDVIENEREWAEKAIPQAEDQLQIAQANYNLALAGLDDNSAVSAAASIAGARQALDQALRGPAETDIRAAELQVEQAQLAWEQADINRQKAEEALEDTVLTAPWAGTVLSVETAPGAMIGAGTPVVMLQDLDSLLFQTNNLSERDLAQLEPGLAAEITLKAYPNELLPGHIRRVMPLAQGTIGDSATFAVLIELEESDLALLPGMTGRVEIEGK